MQVRDSHRNGKTVLFIGDGEILHVSSSYVSVELCLVNACVRRPWFGWQGFRKADSIFQSTKILLRYNLAPSSFTLGL